MEEKHRCRKVDSSRENRHSFIMIFVGHRLNRSQPMEVARRCGIHIARLEVGYILKELKRKRNII